MILANTGCYWYSNRRLLHLSTVTEHLIITHVEATSRPNFCIQYKAWLLRSFSSTILDTIFLGMWNCRADALSKRSWILYSSSRYMACFQRRVHSYCYVRLVIYSRNWDGNSFPKVPKLACLGNNHLIFLLAKVDSRLFDQGAGRRHNGTQLYALNVRL